MSDLHGWITQRIDETQRVAELARGHGEGRWHHETGYHSGRVEDERGSTVVYDEGAPLEEEAAHIALHDPDAVLRRCAADRKILADHAPVGGGWPGHYACEGCGYDGSYCPEPITRHVNDCPTLLALAEGYGLTEEQRAQLDRPEKERPEPTGPSASFNALMEAYSATLTDMVLNTRPVERRLHVVDDALSVWPSQYSHLSMPGWLHVDLAPQPTPGERAFAVVEPHLSALALYKPTTDPEA